MNLWCYLGLRDKINVGLFLDPCRLWYISTRFFKTKVLDHFKIVSQSRLNLIELHMNLNTDIKLHAVYVKTIKSYKRQILAEAQ